MRFLVFLLISLSSSFSVNAQTSRKELKAEKEKVKATVVDFIDALNMGDRIKMENTFHFTIRLMTISVKDGRHLIAEDDKNDLLRAIAMPRVNTWKEEITSYEILVDGDLAQVWAKYNFYLDGKIIHCGIDAFQLFKSPDGWKIIQVTDTRVTEGCK